MAWESSNRRDSLPSNWPSIRSRIIRRDGGQCTAFMREGHRCPERTGLEVHHLGAEDDHRDECLTTLCHWHHARETAEQAAKARAKNRAQIRKRFRTQEVHPAFLR